jgi:hypothetical protein
VLEMLRQTWTGVGPARLLAAHHRNGEAKQHTGNSGTPEACTKAHTVTASGSSSHQERTRRCTNTVNTANGTAANSRGVRCKSVVKNTAIMVIANKSSTTARLSRKVRNGAGRWLLITANTASANAMSVATGIAHPWSASPPVSRLISTNSAAGTTMPPTAAATGKAAWRGSRRSPATNSRLSSSPATKKKIASRPSAAHWPTVRSKCSDAGPNLASRTAS